MTNILSTALLIVTVVSVVGPGDGSQDYRNITGYRPLTDVSDQLLIDLDQQLMESFLKLSGGEGFAEAERIYMEGAYYKSVSTLQIPNGLPIDIPEGTKMEGLPLFVNDSSSSVLEKSLEEVQLDAYEGASAGDTSLQVLYRTSGCHVRANPEPIMDRCLESTGNITIPSDEDGAILATFTYTYNILNDTKNSDSIQTFTRSSEFSFDGNPFTIDFQRFVDFFGSESFADDIITAAFAGTSTSFSTGKDIDMTNYEAEARAEIIAKASAYMAIRINILREMERGIYLCETGDCNENSCIGKRAVHEVDEAVAFYSGSLEGTDGTGDGVLHYNLADTRAENFKTAGVNGDSVKGTAKANYDVMKVFQQASNNIVKADCAAVRQDTTRLAQLMAIPLIQGTLRYTYFTGVQGDTKQGHEAERAIFAASVLPMVAECSSDDADLIYENTKAGNTSPDFAAVKKAFERNYECMGLTNADIGGLWDSVSNAYFEGAGPGGVSGGSSGGSGSSGGTNGSGSAGEDSGVIPVAPGAGMVMIAPLLLLIG